MFVDVASFTEVTETGGDEAAARLLSHVDGMVRRGAALNDGKLVKQLGDGFMLAFYTPVGAVNYAQDLQRAAQRSAEPVHLRIGLNTGIVIYRGGDYIGSTVNIASRVAAAAMPDQTLMTESVALEAQAAGIPVEKARAPGSGSRQARNPLPALRSNPRRPRVRRRCCRTATRPTATKRRRDLVLLGVLLAEFPRRQRCAVRGHQIRSLAWADGGQKLAVCLGRTLPLPLNGK